MESKNFQYIKVLKGFFLTFIPLIIFLILIKEPAFYEVYCNEITIGYTDSKYKIEKIYSNILKELSNNFNSIKEGENRFTYKKVNKSNTLILSDEILKENILEKIDVKVEGYKLTANDIDLGYISKEDEGKTILENLGYKYMEINKLEEENIKSIDVKANFNYESEYVYLSEISNINDIVEKIIELNKKTPVTFVEISALKKERRDIESPVSYINSKDMFLGESKRVDGQKGIKDVEEKVLYVNDKVKSIEILEENILVDATESIIYKGIKNPIEENLKFLKIPSRGYISSNYGSRWNGEKHHGIDIAANSGTDIIASLDGKVIDTSYHSIYGKKVILDHGNKIQTLYGHCSEILVKKGDKVKKGDVIAKVGNTGRSTGPHVHFELRVNGKAINPNNYIE